jgi:hypothetical protein
LRATQCRAIAWGVAAASGRLGDSCMACALRLAVPGVCLGPGGAFRYGGWLRCAGCGGGLALHMLAAAASCCGPNCVDPTQLSGSVSRWHALSVTGKSWAATSQLYPEAHDAVLAVQGTLAAFCTPCLLLPLRALCHPSLSFSAQLCVHLRHCLQRRRLCCGLCVPGQAPFWAPACPGGGGLGPVSCCLLAC